MVLSLISWPHLCSRQLFLHQTDLTQKYCCSQKALIGSRSHGFCSGNVLIWSALIARTDCTSLVQPDALTVLKHKFVLCSQVHCRRPVTEAHTGAWCETTTRMICPLLDHIPAACICMTSCDSSSAMYLIRCCVLLKSSCNNKAFQGRQQTLFYATKDNFKADGLRANFVQKVSVNFDI